MSPDEFVAWMQGYVKAHGAGPLTAPEWREIRDKLRTVEGSGNVPRTVSRAKGRRG